MKTAKLLKNFIDVFFLILTLAIFFEGILLVLFMITGGFDTVVNVPKEYENLDLSSWITQLFLLLALLEYILFIIGIYFLKRSLSYLVKGDYYSEKVITYFNKAGRLLVTVGITTLVLRFLAEIILIGTISLKLDFTAFSLLFVTIMGLFFMLFSTIFSNAKKLKEENELTI